MILTRKNHARGTLRENTMRVICLLLLMSSISTIASPNLTGGWSRGCEEGPFGQSVMATWTFQNDGTMNDHTVWWLNLTCSGKPHRMFDIPGDFDIGQIIGDQIYEIDIHFQTCRVNTIFRSSNEWKTSFILEMDLPRPQKNAPQNWTSKGPGIYSQ